MFEVKLPETDLHLVLGNIAAHPHTYPGLEAAYLDLAEGWIADRSKAE